MGRRQYKVNDETAYRWAEKHRRGDSFRKIALDEGVDRRLVARVVRGLDKAKHLNEVAAALRDVRAGFLRQHLELLEKVASSLLELTAPPSLASLRGSLCINRLDVDEELLDRVEKERYVDIAGLLLVPSVSSQEEEKDPEKLLKLQLAQRRAKREARVLVEDLKEHLPHLWPVVKEWERVVANCEASWKELARQVEDKGIAQDLFEPGVGAGLNFLSKFKQAENLPRVPQKLETASDVGVWLFRNGSTRDSLGLFQQSLKELEGAYGQLEELLNPLALRKALLARQCKHCPLA